LATAGKQKQDTEGFESEDARLALGNIDGEASGGMKGHDANPGWENYLQHCFQQTSSGQDFTSHSQQANKNKKKKMLPELRWI